jgi:predicted Zn-dependent protease
LGVILLKRGRLADSESALLKAVSLNADLMSIQVHLAEVYAAQGFTDKAQPLIARLLERTDTLDPNERNVLLRLRHETGTPK